MITPPTQVPEIAVKQYAAAQDNVHQEANQQALQERVSTENAAKSAVGRALDPDNALASSGLREHERIAKQEALKKIREQHQTALLASESETKKKRRFAREKKRGVPTRTGAMGMEALIRRQTAEEEWPADAA